MEERHYLEKDFNPKSLTVAKLRGILNEYDVAIPSNAKKADLIDAFNKHIGANAAELLRKHKAEVANANGNGIVNEDATSDSDSESESESEAEKEPVKRQTRLSTPKPTKTEDKVEIKKNASKQVPEQHEAKGDDGSSPFSKENVFQSPPPSTIPHKRVKSPTATPNKLKMAKLSPNPRTPRGKLFDDDDDDSDKDELFSTSATKISRKAKTPKSPAESKSRVAKEKVKDSTVESKSVVGDDKPKDSPVESKPKVDTKSRVGKDKEKVKEKSLSKKKKELEKELQKENNIVKKELESGQEHQLPSIALQILSENFPTFDSLKIPQNSVVDLAKDLGIVVQGLPPQDTLKTPRKEPLKTPKKEVKKVTPKRTPKLGRALNAVSLRNTPVAKAESDKETSSVTAKSAKSSLVTEKVDESVTKSDNAVEESIEHDLTGLEQDLNAVSSKVLKSALKQKTSSKTSPSTIFAFIMIWITLFLVGLFGWWYREQTFLIGYCGQVIYQDTIPLDPQTTPSWLLSFGEYLDTFKPVCSPCPPHGRCFPLLELSCYNDFIDDQPWYFNLVPYPVDSKKCIPDTKKAEKLEIMIDVALDLLRSRNAASNCGRNAEDDLTLGLSVADLHDMLLQMKAPYITRDEFEDLWSRSLLELEKEPEIIVRQVEKY